MKLTLSVVMLAMAASAGAQSAPAGRCKFVFDNTPNTTVASVMLPSKQYNYFVGRGVVARCPQQKLVLKSDSLEIYGDEGRFYFVGHVDYAEPRLKLKSDYLTYFQKEERLLASFNVDATLPTGSELKGSSLEYFKVIPRIRPQQSAVAVGRPTISIIDRDPQGKAQPPVNVTGNTVWMQGDSIVASSGEVVVVRPELTATGDSLYLDAGKGLIRVMRKPKITGTKGRPFTLVGETIDLTTKKKKLDRVLALKSAEAVSEDLDLKSDTIDLRVSDDLLQRAIAWGKSRAHATSPTQVIVSDSIDVLMPAQRIHEMHAVRSATAEATPDTTKFHTTERDRLAGDTILATFDSVIVRDTVKPRIKQLVAIGHASSYQHLPDRDSTCKVPAINYVLGRIITATFDSTRGVKTVVVQDQDPHGGMLAEPNEACGRGTVTTPSKAAGTPSAPPKRPPATDELALVAVAGFRKRA